jgi:hypothetical protein
MPYRYKGSDVGTGPIGVKLRVVSSAKVLNVGTGSHACPVLKSKGRYRLLPIKESGQGQGPAPTKDERQRDFQRRRMREKAWQLT